MSKKRLYAQIADTRAEPLERLVLWALVLNSRKRLAAPALSIVAHETGLSRRRVQYAMRRLEAEGVIARRSFHVGPGATITYELFPAPPE